MKKRTVILLLAFIIIFPIFCVATVYTEEVEAIPAPPVNSPVTVFTTEPETEPKIESLGVFRLTAYCTCPICCEKWSAYNHDKDGNPVGAGKTILINNYSVAADTDLLPFGTIVLIEGKEYKVQDRGGSIKGNRIDVFFESHQDAVNFGVQYKEIFIERKENK